MLHITLLFTFLTFTTLVRGHVAFWHPSMWGFNVTQQTYPYDNRPVTPLVNYSFDKWWFHGHLDHPPHAGDFFELPAGQPATAELAIHKGATSYFASSEGGDIRQGNNPAPNSPLSAIHTTGFDDLTGCALAISYKSDVTQVKPEDFTVFSVNHTCVWTRFTDFQVPARMPACPEGGCICSWFWIHSPNSGGEQNYMNGFRCNVTGATSEIPLAQPKIPRRCGEDKANKVFNPTPGNCTYGAKNPFYWFQAERNNMPEGTYSPPIYNSLYNFEDGPQDDIFVDSYADIPTPSAEQKIIPSVLPVSETFDGVSSLLQPPPTSSQISSASVPSLTSSTRISSAPSPSLVTSSSTTGSQPPPSAVPSSAPPEVTVTDTVVVTVFASAPSSTPVPPSSATPVVTVFSTVEVTVYASDPVSTPVSMSNPSSIQEDINNFADTKEFVVDSSTPPPGCKAKPVGSLQKRSTFASRLLRHTRRKRDYSLWHMF